MGLAVGASEGDVALLLAAVRCHSAGARLEPQIRHRIRQLELHRSHAREGAASGGVPWSVLQQAVLEAVGGPVVGNQSADAGLTSGAPGAGAMPQESSKFEQMLRILRQESVVYPGQATGVAVPSGAPASSSAGALRGEEARELLGCIRSLQSAVALDSLAARASKNWASLEQGLRTAVQGGEPQSSANCTEHGAGGRPLRACPWQQRGEGTGAAGLGGPCTCCLCCGSILRWLAEAVRARALPGPCSLPLLLRRALQRWLAGETLCSQHAGAAAEHSGGLEDTDPPAQAPGGALDLSLKLLRVLAALYQEPRLAGSQALVPAESGESSLGRAHACVLEMVHQGLGLQELQRLPALVTLPLLQALDQCRLQPGSGWPASAYILMGREDLLYSGPGAPWVRHTPASQATAGLSAPVDSSLRTPIAMSSQLRVDPREENGSGPSPLLALFPAAAWLRPVPSESAWGVGAPSAASTSGALSASTPGEGGAGGAPRGAAGGGPRGVVRGLAGSGAGRDTASTAASVSRGDGSGWGGAGLGDPLVCDGMEHIAHLHRLGVGGAAPGPQSGAALGTAPGRFPHDLRLSDVRRLLCSAVPLSLGSPGTASSGPSASGAPAGDADSLAAQQAALLQVSARTVTLPLGRAAFTFSTTPALCTQGIVVPDVVLSGVLPTNNNASVSLDVGPAGIQELTGWPEFHNGVAAGLQYQPPWFASPAPGTSSSSSSSRVPHASPGTRAWIMYNKPNDASSSHAGVVLALGLQGHLAALATTDLYRYLAQEHETTTIAVLLGMAAARRGSMDATVAKMLYLHILSRHPASYPDLEVSPLVQAAALLGVGLLYQGSNHRLTAEILLDELGRRPAGAAEGMGQQASAAVPGGSADCREGYSLAAGLALGLVTLGSCGRAWGLADLGMEDRLQAHFASASIASFTQNLAGDPVTDGSTADSLLSRHPSASGWAGSASQRRAATATMPLARDRPTNGLVLGGALPSWDATAPGAILALALMYLKSNDEAMASRVQLPSTHYALEFVRPDEALLRVLAAGLILWDSVLPTAQWMESQLPGIIQSCLATSAPSSSGRAPPDALEDADVDKEALALTHYNAVAGSCLLIGFRYAGTADSKAKQLLTHYLLLFLRDRRLSRQRAHLSPSEAALVSWPGGPWKGEVDKGTVEKCLTLAALSLSLVMSGTGDLGCFRLLRYVRCCTNAAKESPVPLSRYGAHCMMSMAIGFLFLGTGLTALSSSNEAVAALLISLFPHFPLSPSDNRFYLQAFRHLWALAARSGALAEAVDVDTLQRVRAPLGLSQQRHKSQSQGHSQGQSQQGGEGQREQGPRRGQAAEAAEEGGMAAEVLLSAASPCLLPEVDEAEEKLKVSVHGPDFWERTWDVDASSTPQDGPTKPESRKAACAACVKMEEARRLQEGQGSAAKGDSAEDLADLLLLEEEEDTLEEGLEEESEEEEEEEEEEGGGEEEDAAHMQGTHSQMEWERTGGGAAGAPQASDTVKGSAGDKKAGRRPRHGQEMHRVRGTRGAWRTDQWLHPESTSSSKGVQLVVKRRWSPGHTKHTRHTGHTGAPGGAPAQGRAANGTLGSGPAAGAGRAARSPEWSAADPLLLLSEALLLQLPAPNTRPACAPALNWPKIQRTREAAASRLGDTGETGQAALLPPLSSLFPCPTPPLFSAFWSTFCVPPQAHVAGSPSDATLAMLGQLSLAPHARPSFQQFCAAALVTSMAAQQPLLLQALLELAAQAQALEEAGPSAEDPQGGGPLPQGSPLPPVTLGISPYQRHSPDDIQAMRELLLALGESHLPRNGSFIGDRALSRALLELSSFTSHGARVRG